MDNKELNNETVINDVKNDVSDVTKTASDQSAQELSHEESLKLMSPMQMVLRRFFRSKLSIIGLIMIVSLFLFCWVGPLFYQVSPTEIDKDGKVEYTEKVITYTDENGIEHSFVQIIETNLTDNMLSEPSLKHPLGTDKTGKDVLARLMNGGKISLTISFMAGYAVSYRQTLRLFLWSKPCKGQYCTRAVWSRGLYKTRSCG